MRFTHAHKTNAENGYKEHQKTYYQVLGVATDADLKTIKRAYYKLSQSHHPDKTDDLAKQKLFPYMAEAYDILSDEELRTSYDDMLPRLTGQYDAPKPANNGAFFKPSPNVSSVSRSRRSYHANETSEQRRARIKKEIETELKKFAKNAVSLKDWFELAKRLSDESVSNFRTEATVVNGILDFLSQQANLDEQVKAKLTELDKKIPASYYDDLDKKDYAEKSQPLAIPAMMSVDELIADLSHDPAARRCSTNLLFITLAELIHQDKIEFTILVFQHILNQSDNAANPAQNVKVRIHLAEQLVKKKRFDQAYQMLTDAEALLQKVDSTDDKVELTVDLELAKLSFAREVSHELYNVCMKGDLQTLKKYLAMRGVTAKPDLIVAATRSKQLEMVKYIYEEVLKGHLDYQEYSGWCAPHYAAQSDSVDILRYFHQKQPGILDIKVSAGRIRAGSQTCLLVAANNKALEAIKFLAQINPKSLNTADDGDWNPLSTAYYQKSLPTFNLLLELGANPNAMYKSSTKESMLHRLVYDEQKPYVQALLATNKIELGRNTSNKTAVDIAQERGTDGWVFSATAIAKEILQDVTRYQYSHSQQSANQGVKKSGM